MSALWILSCGEQMNRYNKIHWDASVVLRICEDGSAMKVTELFVEENEPFWEDIYELAVARATNRRDEDMTEEELKDRMDADIGYIAAAYFDWDHCQRLYDALGIEHPVFGRERFTEEQTQEAGFLIHCQMAEGVDILVAMRRVKERMRVRRANASPH